MTSTTFTRQSVRSQPTVGRHDTVRRHFARRRSTVGRYLTRRFSLFLSRVGDRERGDVPGWVLITLMTAGLVVAIWAIAGPALTEMFDSALKSVKGP